MEFLTDRNLVRLPEKRILKLAGQVLLAETVMAMVWLQLLGLLNAAVDLVPLGRLYTRPLQLHLLALWHPASGDLAASVPVPQMIQDHLLRWTGPTWLRTGVPLLSPPPHLSVYTDASLSGWGAHLLLDCRVVSSRWPSELSDKHINWLEIKAVWLALSNWETLSKRQEVLVLSDNSTVVSYLQKQGGTRSPTLCMLLYQMMLWCRDHEISLKARHIPGHLNVMADSLSRRGQLLHTEWSLSPEIFRMICTHWETPMIDLFATRWNRQLLVFVSPVPDPLAWAVDALSISLEGLIAYALRGPRASGGKETVHQGTRDQSSCHECGLRS